MAGLTAAGFEIKRSQDILAELKAELRAAVEWGPAANLSPRSAIGQLLGVCADREADLWLLLQATYSAVDPESAEGRLLENLCALVGVTRTGETKLAMTLTASGTAGVVIPVGSIVRVPAGERFISTAAATIGGGGTVDLEVEAEEAGYLEIGTNTVTSIVTPVLGWSSITGPSADTAGGSGTEEDVDLRRRRKQSLQGGGSATDGAIRAAVLDIGEVQQAVVVSNRSSATENGIPPKAFHTIVYPSGLSSSVEEEIAEAIYRRMPAGIYSHGTEVYTVTDSMGYEQTVRFSYSAPVAVAVVATVTVDEDLAPTDAQDLIEDAITSLFEGEADSETGERSGGIEIGQDVLYAQVYTTIYNACAGVLAITLAINGGAADVSIDLYTGEIAELSAFGSGSTITVTT